MNYLSQNIPCRLPSKGPQGPIRSADAASVPRSGNNGSKAQCLPMKGPMVIALLATTAPMLLGAEMIANCWAHGKTREVCDPDSQVPLMVQAAVTGVFAYLATPPQ